MQLAKRLKKQFFGAEYNFFCKRCSLRSQTCWNLFQTCWDTQYLFFFQNPDPAQQPLDYYYYDDRDTSKYSNRKGPLYDYGDYYEMDDRIRDIRKNDAIFR